jgi:hypothetical protein
MGLKPGLLLNAVSNAQGEATVSASAFAFSATMRRTNRSM